jgi:hypothetical protein
MSFMESGTSKRWHDRYDELVRGLQGLINSLQDEA